MTVLLIWKGKKIRLYAEWHPIRVPQEYATEEEFLNRAVMCY